MDRQPNAKLDRRRRQIAASYRKQGYRVLTPSAADTLPPFLHDCHPDLIAEKADDRVVIEIKASHQLRGTNDLPELADRVAMGPGWRLELVTLGTDGDYLPVLAPDWLAGMLRSPAPGIEIGRHCVYLGEVLAYLVRRIALLSNIRIRDKTTLNLARELVYLGAIDQDLLDPIEDALEWQDCLMRRLPVTRSAAQQAADLEEICRNLHAQAQNPED